VDRLLATADQLKRAQLGPAPTAVSVAAKAYQDAIAALVEESLAHVTGAGHATTAAARNRLTGTLMAAATDPALRELLALLAQRGVRPALSHQPISGRTGGQRAYHIKNLIVTR
jgi:hypothetical protein